MALPHFKPMLPQMTHFLSVEELNFSGGVFHHELLVMEGLRTHRALEMGSAMVRLGRGRDDSPSFS